MCQCGWMGLEGMIGVHEMAETLCCSPETATTLLIGYIPIQNKKFEVWEEKIGVCL